MIAWLFGEVLSLNPSLMTARFADSNAYTEQP
jgi:hypothetical protein